MKENFTRIKGMGERAILIEFEPEISKNLLEIILFYKNYIQQNHVKVKGEVINAYNSLLVVYNEDIEDVYSEVSVLEKMLEKPPVTEISKSTLFHIPVCYDSEFGLDLQEISHHNDLSKEEIIGLHSAPDYTVYFIGFLPGFLYLGGLDERLYISRKNEPRLKVEKGAVGIGEKQTGIYPQVSPGGWQIIGNSPVQIFDKTKYPPCEISAGDKVRFYPVSKEEFYDISEEVKSGKFYLSREAYEG